MNKKDNDSDVAERQPKPKFVVRSVSDVQRIKLQKLMENPTKEVVIPVPRQKKDGEFGNAPSFVRNVMGSSAGAGSGEFHVYRHLRRKEYARQKNIQQMSKQEQLDEDFKNRLEKNRNDSEQKTAKKRAKRMKKKQNAKNRKLNPKQQAAQQEESSAEESDDDNEDEEKVCEENGGPATAEAGKRDSDGATAQETSANDNNVDEAEKSTAATMEEQAEPSEGS